MDYKNVEVALTVKIGGAQALLGRYESMKKVDDKGSKIFEIWKNPLDESIERIPAIQLRTTQLPKFHECEQHTTLGGYFCAYAVSDEARPKKTVSVPWWNKLSKTNRLKFAIKKYVADLYGENAEYSFQILSE